MTPSPFDIDNVAAVWATAFERGLSTSEQEALNAWLANDSRNLGAYARARAVACSSEKLRALGAGAVVHIPPAMRMQTSTTRRGVLAAGLVVAFGAAGVGAAAWRGRQSYRTALGEVGEYELDDGSHLSLSPLSSVSVRIGRSSRDIVMTAGEVLVEVAADARPFRVLAAGAVINAVAGRILLQRFEQRPLQVAALDMPVTVASPQQPRLSVRPGQEIELSPAAPTATAMDKAAIDRALAWRHGKLALHDHTLMEASRTFARFSPLRLVFDRPSTAAMRITGLFDARDPASFAQAAAASLGLDVILSQGAIQLSSQNYAR